MPTGFHRILVLTCLALSLPALGSELPRPVAQVMEWHQLSEESVSIWVQAVDEAEPLLAYRADVSRNPASVTKLFTTYAALEALGPAYRWRTEVYARGEPQGGVLDGDLWIKGYGDPFLVNEEFWKLVGEIRRLGIDDIRGDLVFDNSHYALAPEDPGAFDNQPFRAYNQPPHPLLVNFNALQFHVQPDPERDAVRVQADPPLPGLRLENRLRPGDGNCGGYQRGVSYSVPEEGQVVLEGRYARACDRFRLLRVAVSPPVYAHGLFQLYWRQLGGTFAGGWREDVWLDDEREPLAVHHSRPLGDLVRVVNKYSNNVMTRHFKLALGVEAFGEPATERKGNLALLDVLESSGIDTRELVVDNAAGLSRTNRASAHQVAALLQQAYRSGYAPEFLSSLSLAGMDGTVRRRFQDTEETGRMRLKTGRLNDVSAIAGYVRTAADRDLVVVVLVNAPDAHRGSGEAVQDAVLRWAYRQ
ncbi:MAG: D-alanyl-D-alanine carboxypeptidase/D-alanyl-D-alanine-endopeptidase [Ectothiorhodospiraceae bacterium]|nr:D-alanyl-D-alanine carboxypeptidase/D-alanyl-D-alanine-endopeptidase [Ectothiorhodospiraceae bacterium]